MNLRMMKGAATPVRADRIAAFTRRELASIGDVDAERLRSVMQEWDDARDFWVGPRIFGGRMMGVGLGFLLGHPEPAPFYDPDHRQSMARRTREAGAFSEREVAAVVLLEDLEEDAIKWKHMHSLAWRVRDRSHRKRRGCTAEFKKEQEAYFARYGSRRPREFWQQAALRLRDEAGLRVLEVVALFQALKKRRCWWWRDASEAAVRTALRRAKLLTHPSMRRWSGTPLGVAGLPTGTLRSTRASSRRAGFR